MSRIVLSKMQSVGVMAFLLSIQGGVAQNPAANPFGIYRGKAESSNASSTPKKPAPKIGASTVSKQGASNAPRPVGTITDTSFAGRLGRSVGARNYPTVALPPGVSNINHPGFQPMPSMQPLPTTIGHPLPSINHPGGTPSMHAPPQDFRKGRRHGFSGRGTTGVVYYGVPYYVPYYVYPESNGEGADSAAAPVPGYLSSSPSGVDSGSTSSPDATTPVLTLLAFKDSTVVIVVEYWLEGDWLYYVTPSGHRLSGPLDRLDQTLTQQLNRERNVPFILEARR